MNGLRYSRPLVLCLLVECSVELYDLTSRQEAFCRYLVDVVKLLAAEERLVFPSGDRRRPNTEPQESGPIRLLHEEKSTARSSPGARRFAGGVPHDGYGRPVRGVAVADCAREDGPRLQTLPVAQRRGDRSRALPCQHAPVQLGFPGFDILHRLWTLPYNFLTRVVCATVSVIVRRRRGSPARADRPSARR
ncbi:hypothetical protein EYF80_053319 [Liparis tanakae]|uniref:Secreted protein n=1 Tax=Liparis tanakae TaxID=230148 RepID=A0A4Z2F6X6_9TELE|nr:hypothetical protein EYF80_053319 [Liparis tanakae]